MDNLALGLVALLLNFKFKEHNPKKLFQQKKKKSITCEDEGVGGSLRLLEILSRLRISADFSSSALSYRYKIQIKIKTLHIKVIDLNIDQ